MTGASRGIGRAVAETLAERGIEVIAWARTRADLVSLGPTEHVRAVAVDVSDPASVLRGIEQSLGRDEALRAVVVNAGVGEWRPVSEVPPDEWDTILGTNLGGALHTLQAALPALHRHEDPQVVVISSDSATFAHPGRGAYCASKAALSALTECLRREERERGIRVTQLAPSRVDTYFRGKTPGGRSGSLQPADVAAVVAWVLSLPRHIEIRTLDMASIYSTYGPYPEHMPEPR